MLEKLKEAFLRFTFLHGSDLLQLASIIKLKSIKKGEYFIREGEFFYQTGIVLKGLLRHYHIDKEGNEKTVLFVCEKNISASALTIFMNKPSQENVIALEDTVILKADTREFEKIAKSNIRLVKLQNEFLKEVIISDIEQIKSLTVYTPEERYQNFCKTYPRLEQRIKQKYLASYLGITPTSLSRMRARISSFL